MILTNSLGGVLGVHYTRHQLLPFVDFITLTQSVTKELNDFFLASRFLACLGHALQIKGRTYILTD